MIRTLLFIACLPLSLLSQTMTVDEYEPRSTLVVPEHQVTQARYPFVDVHSHQWRMTVHEMDSVIAAMDQLNMAALVNLSGYSFYVFVEPSQEKVDAARAHLRRALKTVQEHPSGSRFVMFTNISYFGVDDPGWTERTVRQLEEEIELGAKGLKIYKDLGLTLKDKNGNRIPTDDARFDPIWAKCGELGVPVLIHTGEPSPFWMPKDKYNERWYELKIRPQRYRNPKDYPPWQQVMNEQHNVFRKHPNTTFISAHLGWMGNDLESLGNLLDECPNVYTEIGAVLAELGRQPRFARAWFTKYQDRILFGKDITHDLSEYHVYFRCLETVDEYFKYYRKRHAHWRLYGLDLPDDVLKKFYYKNALRIIPGLDASLFPTD